MAIKSGKTHVLRSGASHIRTLRKLLMGRCLLGAVSCLTCLVAGRGGSLALNRGFH